MCALHAVAGLGPRRPRRANELRGDGAALWELLARLPVRGPRIGFEAVQPGPEVREREVARGDSRRELVPGERDGDGRLWLRAGRVGGHARRAADVAQVVDEDLAPSLGLRHARDVPPRIGADRRLGDDPRELGGLVPARTRRDRSHDVQALAAGRLHEARELERLESVADEPRAVDDLRPLDTRAWIQIEHDAIRLFEP